MDVVEKAEKYTRILEGKERDDYTELEPRWYRATVHMKALCKRVRELEEELQANEDELGAAYGAANAAGHFAQERG